MSAPSSSPTGLHKLTFEYPDVIMVRLQGDISLEEVQQFTEVARPVTAGVHYWLLDSSRAGHFGAEARKWAADSRPPSGYRGTAVFGVNFSQRVLATMLMTAMRLLQPQRPPIYLFATEAQARAWVKSARRQAAPLIHPALAVSSAP